MRQEPALTMAIPSTLAHGAINIDPLSPALAPNCISNHITVQEGMHLPGASVDVWAATLLAIKMMRGL